MPLSATWSSGRSCAPPTSTQAKARWRPWEKIVAEVRRHRPRARIVIRADSGFFREAILVWCEANGMDHVVGLARNARLQAEIEPALASARGKARMCGGAARVYHVFDYKTQNFWSRSRRVVAKAERLGDKDNPRFIVTSLPGEASAVYDKFGLRAARWRTAPRSNSRICLATGSPRRASRPTSCGCPPSTTPCLGGAPARLRPERHGARAGERGHAPVLSSSSWRRGWRRAPPGAGALERGQSRP